MVIASGGWIGSYSCLHAWVQNRDVNRTGLRCRNRRTLRLFQHIWGWSYSHLFVRRTRRFTSERDISMWAVSILVPGWSSCDSRNVNGNRQVARWRLPTQHTIQEIRHVIDLAYGAPFFFTVNHLRKRWESKRNGPWTIIQQLSRELCFATSAPSMIFIESVMFDYWLVCKRRRMVRKHPDRSRRQGDWNVGIEGY